MRRRLPIKQIAFIPADDNTLKYAEMCINSLRKFHSEEELPVVVIKGDDLKQRLVKDPMFFYRAASVLGKEFMEKGWDLVIKLDADMLITGDLSELWNTEDNWDIAVVQNSNPKNLQEHQDATGQILTVLDIHPLHYVNAGLVAMRSKEFVNHWYDLCYSYHFDTYQFKEQDLLNILVHYGNYKTKFLDASNKWYGLILKGYEIAVEVEDVLQDGLGSSPFPQSRTNQRLILKKNGTWPQEEDKQIIVWHAAGGNTPNKMNYRTKFQPSVVKYLDQLIKP